MLMEKNQQEPRARFWNRQKEWSWQRQTLRAVYGGRISCSYYEPIPEFVLRKAVSIVEKLPQVELCVETLSNEDIHDDPFLIAKFNHEEEFYIEVWNEAKFEGKL